MCGGFAALIGMNSGTILRNLRAQLIYSGGRLMSYMTLGAVAGFAGKQTIAAVPSMINIPALLCLFSGVYLVREGIIGLGLLSRIVKGQSTAGCLIRPLFSAIFRRPGLRNSFVAGILTGLLPCGLVYAFVSLAASSGDFLSGMSTMGAFGLGTVPLLVIAGTGASLISWTARQRLMKLSAVSVIATGLLTLGRGAAFLQTTSEAPRAACPFCSAKSTSHVFEPATSGCQP
jgi:sulfite exporter TauE/SafE